MADAVPVGEVIEKFVDLLVPGIITRLLGLNDAVHPAGTSLVISKVDALQLLKSKFVT